ncbi:MAG: hypothetical protein AB7I36_03790 [Rhodospirillaceae bacterium]
MPEGGGGKTARLHGSASLHLRTLTALHDSLFAPHFRALENYGATPPPPPTISDVVTAAKAALAWHRGKEIEVAAELDRRRAGGGNPALIDETARTLAHHRSEQERIGAELAALQ